MHNSEKRLDVLRHTRGEAGKLAICAPDDGSTQIKEGTGRSLDDVQGGSCAAARANKGRGRRLHGRASFIAEP